MAINFPDRDSGSPKLRMGAWNLNDLCVSERIGHPKHSSSEPRVEGFFSGIDTIPQGMTT